MLKAQVELNNEKLEDILGNNPDILIPRLFLENSWTLNSSVTIHYMYLKRPKPTFRLGALHRAFEEYLRQNSVDPTASTLVGGRLHRYEPKPVLSLEKFMMNSKFIAGNANNVWAWRLTLRASWAGITLCFWTRSSCLYVYKGYHMDNTPTEFITNLLKDTVNYPRFVVMEAVRKNYADRLLQEVSTIWMNDLRGWRIEL